MKYVLIVLLFLACVGVGYIFSVKYRKRKNFFAAIIALADKLSLEINFSRERLKNLLESFDKETAKHLLGVDEKFVEYLDKKSELVDAEIFKKADCLKSDEKNLILLFLKTLGRSDVENQTKEISNFKAQFGEIKKKCDEEQKKYGTLSIKLGVVAGLFCAIILI